MRVRPTSNINTNPNVGERRLVASHLDWIRGAFEFNWRCQTSSSWGQLFAIQFNGSSRPMLSIQQANRCLVTW